MFSLLNPNMLNSNKGKYKIMNNPILIFNVTGIRLIKINTIKAHTTFAIAVK